MNNEKLERHEKKARHCYCCRCRYRRRCVAGVASAQRLQNCIGFLGKYVKRLLVTEQRVTLKLKGADRRSVTSVAVASCQSKKRA